MSDNINQMNYKQLRNEVQLLRDELAIMKRKYEDIIYNLDTDNFSSRFVKEQGDMRTAIEVTAEGIKTKVSKEDLDKSLSNYSTIEQTADKISTAVSSVNTATDIKLENYSTIEQTTNQISASVEETKEYAEGYVTDMLANGDYVTNATFKSQFDIYADGIYATVEETYETKTDASAEYSSLRGSISSVSVEADNISTRVGSLENGEYGDYTLFKQTNDTFLFDGDYMRISSAVILTDNDGNNAFSMFHNQSDNTVYMWGMDNYKYSPVIIGNKASDGSEQGVYLYSNTDENRIATRRWVLDNAGGSSGTVVAVFG